MTGNGTGNRTAEVTGGGERRSGAPVRRVVGAALAVLVVGLAAAISVTAVRSDDGRQALDQALTAWGGPEVNELTRDHREVAEAARELTEAFLEVDHRDMQPLVDRVLALATGDFEKQYRERRDELIEAARRNRSISRGEVVAIGVGDLDDDSAVVFVAADSEVQNTSTDGTRQPRYYRLKLHLVREDGAWRAAMVEFVG